jgi:hypothetical protein
MAAQALFDALAGAAGHPVDRPALNAFVANSQATNGLRSAQTEEALINAQRAQQQQQAKQDFQAKFAGAVNPATGKPFDPGVIEMVGKAVEAGMPIQNTGELIGGTYKAMAQGTLGDALSTPDQRTLAQQQYDGKVALPYAVPKEFSTLPGGATPNVQQTPLGAAETASAGALGDLRTEQKNNPSAFHNVGVNLQQLSPELQQMVREGRLDPSRLNSRTVNIYDQLAKSNPTANLNQLISDAALQKNAVFRQRQMTMESMPEILSHMQERS